MTMSKSLECPDESAMQQLGADLVRLLSDAASRQCQVITFSGELGAGKSVLARAMVHAAGFIGRVKSPTYTLIETYLIEAPTSAISRIAHLDLYRLADPDELHYLGFDDVLEAHQLVLIEWPDKAGSLLPEAAVHIDIEYLLPAGRRVTLQGDITGSLAQ